MGREARIDELKSAAGVGFGLAATDSEVHGPPEFKPFVRNMRDAFPDMHFVIEDMVAEADKVAVRLTVTGTHKGGRLGFPATDRKITLRPSPLFNSQTASWSRAGTTGTNSA